LHCNEITKIKGLENLRSLRELCLESNQISVIEGLDNLVNLDFLNIADNPIKGAGEYYISRDIVKLYLKNLNNLKKLNNKPYPESEWY